MKNLKELLVQDMIPPRKQNSATIFLRQTVGEAASFFERKNLEEAFVLDEKGFAVGMITLKGLFHGLIAGSCDRPISDIMERTFPALISSAPFIESLDYFAKGYRTIAVLKEDRSFLQTIEIDDVKHVLQNELDSLTEEIDRLPLRELDTRPLLQVLKSISDDTNIRLCITDEKGILQFFNRAYEQLTGISRKRAIGKHVTDVFPESRIPNVLEKGKPEVRYYKSAFENHYVVSRRIPLKKRGEIIGVLSFTLFRDISEMQDLLEKFNLIKNKMEYYKKELESVRCSKYRIENIVGESPAILHLKDLIRKYAQSDSTILIMGESGTGKELVAHAIHQASKRKQYPLIVVNCATIPKDLLESELFGYEPGSFTGAYHKGKPGKFELGNKGTIFLDEVGELPLDMQAKLLRVLQEREVERIGGRAPLPIDFRLIAATNKKQESLIEQGVLRKDLFYRLAVITLSVPPLRDRKEDLSLLIRYILDKLNRKLEKNVFGVNEEVAQKFYRYEWLGNVRELENVLEYAVNNSVSDIISAESLPSFLNLPNSPAVLHITSSRIPLQQKIDDFEKSLILEALTRSKGNRSNAAHTLDISRSGLYKLLKKHRIE